MEWVRLVVIGLFVMFAVSTLMFLWSLFQLRRPQWWSFSFSTSGGVLVVATFLDYVTANGVTQPSGELTTQSAHVAVLAIAATWAIRWCVYTGSFISVWRDETRHGGIREKHRRVYDAAILPLSYATFVACLLAFLASTYVMREWLALLFGVLLGGAYFLSVVVSEFWGVARWIGAKLRRVWNQIFEGGRWLLRTLAKLEQWRRDQTRTGGFFDDAADRELEEEGRRTRERDQKHDEEIDRIFRPHVD